MARAQPNRTRLDPDARRSQILDAAEAVLNRRLAADLTFEAVSDEAGISRALVYNYFGDRNGLLAAVELRSLGRLNACLLAGTDATLDPAGQVRRLAHAYVTFARDHGQMWRLLASTGVRHPSLDAARRLRVERLATLWGATATAAVAAEVVTAALEAVTIGGVCGGPADRGEEPVDSVCRILTDGIAASL